MLKETSKKAKILIVDDQEANTCLLEQILQHGEYTDFKSTNDSRRVLPLYTEFRPDLILLDLLMPHLDGFEIMKQLKSRISEDTYLPILVLTADTGSEVKRKALSMGAKDFLTKPFDVIEVLLRINNLIETRFLYNQLESHNQILEERVRERTRELEDAQTEILERLALAAEYRDDNTGEHAQRVGSLSALTAQTLGLSESQVKLIRQAATLHDIGKIGIPDHILFKPDRLTTVEYEIIRTHITIGDKILFGSKSPLLQMAEEIALTHHERWNGTGYLGLKEEEIPIMGRIVAIVDFFDAVTHERPYKKAWPEEEALAEIKEQSGRHFDPRVVEAFLQVIEGKGSLKREDKS